jgi:hypothetical protein
VWLSETDGAEGPGEPQKPDFTVCSYGPVRAPAERPPCPGSIPPLKRPLRALQTLSRPILCAPDQGQAPFVSAGLLNFHGTAIELYVELGQHPGGFCAWCVGLFALPPFCMFDVRLQCPSYVD